ncbi:hypothetical protein CspeluHIS016_0301950 [Cutaneotrichosporon spelunceum]|uniref:RING-type domain-containing protein n=1 Tax=Cutaneotrichosporon spelunceum TaxID=1672016 RepID=A0AAD3TT23_9TREE|nr:hypothetical protein CspeluHIS016_0301950 [Cutaneotrichosporon spelunceum]
MKWAATADNLAGKIINSMTLVHFAIWVLGSVACFSQVPTLRRENCYRSAPLLWWPLFVTTIIFGWLHAIHYAYIIIGGALLLIIAACYLVLAHIFGWPVRPLLGMVRPRTPQPEKLTEDDLKACPIVAYIPDPSEPLPEPSIYEPSKAESVRESTSQGIASALLKRITGVEGGKSDVASIEDPKHEAQQEQSGEREDGPSDEQRNGGPSREPSSEPSNEPRSELRGEPVPPGEVDPTRLGLPGAVLSAHQITCAICQSSFVPPREVPGREMYVVERLRQLPCKHVFHVECVDNWLMNHSGICPYCSQKVKDLLKAQNVEESTGGGGASPGEDAGRPGMQQRQGPATSTQTPVATAPAALSAPVPATLKPCTPTSVASLTRDLAALALKPPTKRKQRTKKKKKIPEFRYRVGVARPLTRPPSRENQAKGHVHVRIEPRSRRHAMHRRHRVPSPTPTV